MIVNKSNLRKVLLDNISRINSSQYDFPLESDEKYIARYVLISIGRSFNIEFTEEELSLGIILCSPKSL